jgi:hypothetical protein
MVDASQSPMCRNDRNAIFVAGVANLIDGVELWELEHA